MEIWKDIQASTFYVINKSTGTQINCDKYGSIPSSFKPYSTGFSVHRPTTQIDSDSNYRVQPKKFDGYFQCPRPSSHISEVRRPYTSSTKRYIPKRLPDDITKLPRPVACLSFSKVLQSPIPSTTRSEHSNREKFSSFAKTHKSSLPECELVTIANLKTSSIASPSRDVKTAFEIYSINAQEKESAKGYRAPARKVPHRKLKGVFMVEFPTSHDLFRKEKEVLEKTNPVAIEKQKRVETAEYNNLERRRAQKILKNKLIEGG